MEEFRKVLDVISSLGAPSPARIARFGPFELNLDISELSRQGRIVSVQQQSMRILVHLVENAGRVVSREELQATVWSPGTFVEFDSGLYTAVNRVRLALNDSAKQPHYIETIPTVGYRFISPVEFEGGEDAAAQQLNVTQSGDEAQAVLNPKPVGRNRAWRKWIWPAGLVIVLAVVFVLRRNFSKSAEIVLNDPHPFAMDRGPHDHPAFSPDGEMLAFDWEDPHHDHSGIYVQRLDSSTPVRLNTGDKEARRPVWSPDGQRVAFLRTAGAGTLTIMAVPLAGREENQMAEFRKGATPWFDWSHDGKWFAVAEPGAGSPPAIELIAVMTGEQRVLTHPPLGWRGDSLPVFSPDSSRLVFRRTKSQSGVEDLYEVSIRGGEPVRLTFDNRMVSPSSFLPDGGLIFASKRASATRTIWAMGPNGAGLRQLTGLTFDAATPAVSRDGRHVAFTRVFYDVNVWQVKTNGKSGATPLIDSEAADAGAQFSPDGNRIAFESNRSGPEEIWVSDVKGSNAGRLTNGGGGAVRNAMWSPDGRRIAFEWQAKGLSEVYVIGSEGGSPRMLDADQHQNSVPSWSHDGKFLYFASDRSGRQAIWKVAAEGGAVSQVTSEGFAPVESGNGSYLYYFFAGEVRRLSLGGEIAKNSANTRSGTAVVAGLRDGDWGNWTVGKEGLYFMRPVPTGQIEIQYLRFADKAVRTVLVLNRRPVYGSRGLALSPDGETLLFSEVDQSQSDIFLQNR